MQHVFQLCWVLPGCFVHGAGRRGAVAVLPAAAGK